MDTLNDGIKIGAVLLLISLLLVLTTEDYTNIVTGLGVGASISFIITRQHFIVSK